jgi:hypothetical protein
MANKALLTEIIELLRAPQVPQRKIIGCQFLIGWGENFDNESTMTFNKHLQQLVSQRYVPYGSPLMTESKGKKPSFGILMVQYEELKEPEKPKPCGWTTMS